MRSTLTHRLFRVGRIAAWSFVPLSVLFIAGCGQDKGGSAPAPAQMPPAQVTVVTLKPESVVLTRELPGRTNPFLVAEVRPQVTGIVRERLFTEGGRVRRGQALYQLEDATYRAAVQSAQAAVARANATLESARLNARRTGELAKVNAVSRQDNENAIAALRQGEADLKSAQAALENARIMLGYARINAPIGGRIGKSAVTAGALVTANQAAPLATVQQFDPMYVDVTQSASELLQLRREVQAGTVSAADDLPVTVLLEDGTRYSHPGKLTFADLSVDPSTGSFLLRVQVPNPDDWLLPGMYVRAIVSVGERQNAILAPQQAIVRDAKGNASAMVVTADNKVEARAVQASRTVGDRWLIDSGLAAGDRVVVEGLQKIRPGAPVQATERPATPQQAKADGKPDAKADVKADAKADVKADTKSGSAGEAGGAAPATAAR
ncbi:MAG: efflux RND transporter periplasmic adaptor subunit [Burkholderiaceae bacterium]|nr:efflux RND transporter periplasmic adaptor subunit [Burkholderiaceae bacterium]